jgi:NhaA family Na+:H+ antiporter
MISTLKNFFERDTAGGILLMLATALALIFANTALSPLYQSLLDIPVQVRIGTLDIDKPLFLWVNDGLMAVFFFTIGLELKREIIEGELSDASKAVLPIVGAIGGVVVPGFIYYVINRDSPAALAGWAIPTATDIAFALGVLSMLGKRVPLAMKVFLATLAIVDDISAILIIAIFYTTDLSLLSIYIAGSCIAILVFMNWRGVHALPPYILIGLVLWVSVLKSGVHATLAGVVLAFCIPFKIKNEHGHSPARELEHDLHPSVAFVILPLFAFVNAGVPISAESFDVQGGTIPLGIVLGLFVGKQIGIFGSCWLMAQLKLVNKPSFGWLQLYGLSLLCGIGFTMSLFIGSLAFDTNMADVLPKVRLGILVGSLLSAVCGYWFLNRFLPPLKTTNS